MKKFARYASIPVLLLGFAVQAPASVMTYSNLADFQAATTGVTTIDFNGIAATGSYVAYGTGPLSLSGVTFNSNGSMFVIDPGFYGSSYAGGGFLNSDYATVNTITAALPSPVTALAMEFGGLFGGPVDFTFNFSDGSSVSGSSAASIIGGTPLAFIGFTSTVAITSASISMPDTPNYNAIDNFRFGNSVPEPGSLALILLGMSGLAVAGRRRR
jgi:hypothetical protein